MKLVFSHVFPFSKNVVIIKGKAFLAVLLGNEFERIDYNETVPH